MRAALVAYVIALPSAHPLAAHQIPHAEPGTLAACADVLTVSGSAGHIAWTLNRYSSGDDYRAVVVSGTVGEDRGPVGDVDERLFEFDVDQWFNEPNGLAVIGIVAGESDGLRLTPGQRIVAVAAYYAGERVRPHACYPHALLGTPEAEALFAEARSEFGEPAPPRPGTRAKFQDEPGYLEVLLRFVLLVYGPWLLAIAVGLAIGIAVLIVRRRRRRRLGSARSN